MSKRLQVMIPDHEMSEIKRLAKLDHLTVGEWVRRALRHAGETRPGTPPGQKLAALRQAVTYSFPTGDIEQMLSEIELGYSE